jgi:hypothetical protein
VPVGEFDGVDDATLLQVTHMALRSAANKNIPGWINSQLLTNNGGWRAG